LTAAWPLLLALAWPAPPGCRAPAAPHSVFTGPVVRVDAADRDHAGLKLVDRDADHGSRYVLACAGGGRVRNLYDGSGRPIPGTAVRLGDVARVTFHDGDAERVEVTPVWEAAAEAFLFAAEDFAASCDPLARPPGAMTAAERAVLDGLGSPCWRDRSDWRAALNEMGAGRGRLLAWGLRSRDAEVRERCRGLAARLGFLTE